MVYEYGAEGVSYELVNGKVKFIKHYNEELTPDIPKSYEPKNHVDYYRFGIDFYINKPHFTVNTVYESLYEAHTEILADKIDKMAQNGSLNIPGAWGDESVAAQAVGKTVEEIKTIENNVKKICGDWRNAYYNGEATDADFTKMKADAIAAGYETVLAYRKALYEDAMN